MRTVSVTLRSAIAQELTQAQMDGNLSALKSGIEAVSSDLDLMGLLLSDSAVSVRGVSGFDATGATSSVTALNNFFALVGAGARVVFPAGSTVLLDGPVIINGKNLIVDAQLCTFNLVGDNAGFQVVGTVTNFLALGGRIVGDGVNRDADSTKAQVGWLFGNAAGANVQNAKALFVTVESTNIGFKCAAGTGVGSGPAYRVKLIGCHTKNIVGTVGGVGYGAQFSQASGSVVDSCTFDNAQRHELYFAEGRNYTAVNCQFLNHRSTVANSSYRAAVSISRSANVAFTNCLFDNCFDGGAEIDVDPQGTAPENVSNGTVFSKCTFKNSALADIRVGTAPATDGVVSNVSIEGCVMVRGAGNAVSSIVIEGGTRVKVANCLIDGTAAASNFRAITLNGTDGAAYSQDIVVKDNDIFSAGYGIQVAAALQTGTSRIRIDGNNIVATTAELEFVGGESNTTNNNLFYRRSNGKAVRDFSGTGALITVPAGGITGLNLTSASATTISQFSGGTEGAELELFFVNGNVTIKNTNIYTSGGADFVGTSNDVLMLTYRNGAWRERSRSVN